MDKEGGGEALTADPTPPTEDARDELTKQRGLWPSRLSFYFVAVRELLASNCDLVSCTRHARGSYRHQGHENPRTSTVPYLACSISFVFYTCV